MARIVVVYGPRGAGKTTATLRLAERLRARGLRMGGFFQRRTFNELEQRGYDLVRLTDPTEHTPLARPAQTGDMAAATVCSFAFAREAFARGFEWLRADAAFADALVIDEVSKLEVARDGHYEAVRWAVDLDAPMLLLLSVRAEMLYGVVERFELEHRIGGYLELPATEAQLEELALALARAERSDDRAALLGR